MADGLPAKATTPATQALSNRKKDVGDIDLERLDTGGEDAKHCQDTAGIAAGQRALGA